MKKMFTNDLFFLIVVLLTVLSVGVACICSILNGSGFLFDCWTGVIAAAGVLSLYISYKTHNKNVMKGLIGFVLAVILMLDVYYFGFDLSLYESADVLAIDFVFFALDLILIVNHFILASDHGSRPVNILVNQIVLFLQAATSAGYYILTITENALEYGSAAGGSDALIPVINIAFALSCTMTFAAVVCVESRLDVYKARREKADGQ